MSHPVYIVDTGYLLALLDVPGEATAAEVTTVRDRFDAARRQGHACLVPLPVLYETASHITDVKAPRTVARELARALLHHVNLAIELDPDRWFSLDPRPTFDEIGRLFSSFATTHVLEKRSLADAAVCDLAQKERAERDDRFVVYIWTWERKAGSLRSLSPDAEPEPFPPWSD